MSQLTVFFIRVKTIYHRLALLLLLTLLPNIAAAWWNNSWNYMVPINIPAASVNSTIVVNVNFAALLTTLGVSGTLDPNSPRIVRADNATLSTNQEFTDSVYNGATDPVGNGQGETRFILQDAGATTYYLYFDVTANGPKPANPQVPINGNFEVGAAGTATPVAWLSSAASDPSMDLQMRPAETVSVNDSIDGAQPSPVNTNGNPNTGLYSYLMGYRSNYDNGGTATLTRTITIPATSPGNINIRLKPEGWDSATNNNTTGYDFVDVKLIKTGTAAVLLNVAGPKAKNYATCPFSPNYSPSINVNSGTGGATPTTPGWGYYDDWDNGYNGNNHTLGMSATYDNGQQPWTLCSASLSGVAGQTVTLQIQTTNTNMFNSWFLIDDVEWSVVAATLGTPQSNAVNPGSFNAYDTTTAAGAITGYLTTKIAGSTFNLDLIALNTAKTAILTTFTGAVKVDLLDSSSGGTLDSNGCNAAWPVIQTLAVNPVFLPTDNGRHTTSFTENNAWPNARVRITYPATATATAIGCSNDNFAIRPNSFLVSVSDSNSTTAGTTRSLYNTATTGGNVHKAGQPFTISATSLNAQATPSTTTNYTGSPTGTLISCLQPTSGCTLGTLLTTTGTGVWSPAAGVVTSNSATYSDAGAFAMQLVDSSFASVDASDGSTLAQRTITSTSFNVGRFVPDHFLVTTNNTPQFLTFNTSNSNCGGVTPIRSFTYIGQGFGYITQPQALITAQNAGNVSTVNYSYNLWPSVTPITPSAIYTSTPNTLDTSMTTLPTITANNNGTGYATVNVADLLAYTRSTGTPQNAFNANIALAISVTDSSESATTGNGTISTSGVGAQFNGAGSGIAFDSGSLFRYGRLSLGNGNGSVNLNLPIPMQAQYYNGTNFVTNSADNCTLIAATNVGMGNYQANLTPCETATVISGTLLGGISNLKLLAPGANHNGSLDLNINLGTISSANTCLVTGTTTTATGTAAQSYLQGKWTGSTYTVNPTARATFGIYKNANQFIFMRELY